MRTSDALRLSADQHELGRLSGALARLGYTTAFAQSGIVEYYPVGGGLYCRLDGTVGTWELTVFPSHTEYTQWRHAVSAPSPFPTHLLVHSHARMVALALWCHEAVQHYRAHLTLVPNAEWSRVQAVAAALCAAGLETLAQSSQAGYVLEVTLPDGGYLVCGTNEGPWGCDRYTDRATLAAGDPGDGVESDIPAEVFAPHALVTWIVRTAGYPDVSAVVNDGALL